MSSAGGRDSHQAAPDSSAHWCGSAAAANNLHGHCGSSQLPHAASPHAAPPATLATESTIHLTGAQGRPHTIIHPAQLAHTSSRAWQQRVQPATSQEPTPPQAPLLTRNSAHAAAAAVSIPTASPPLRIPSQRQRKKTLLAFDELQDEHHSSSAQTAASVAVAAVASQYLEQSSDEDDDQPSHSLSSRQVHRDRTAVKVPKSPDRWVVVGVFIASRDFPSLPFFVQLIDYDTGRRLDSTVPYKSMMATLSPKYNQRELILLHTRVVQQLDEFSIPTGDVRYLCTDIAVSYRMGDTGFRWINLHPNMFQVCAITWIASLSRSELQEHLAMASTKGRIVFQSAEAETTRTFLRAVLQGKALLAQCTLRTPPPLEQTANAAAQGAGTGAAAALSINLPLPLHSTPDVQTLFTVALAQSSPLWFHHSESEVAIAKASSAAAPASRMSDTASTSSSAAAAAEPSPGSGLSLSSRLPKLKVDPEPALLLSLLPFVQFISVPAMAKAQRLPSVIICNQIKKTRPNYASSDAHATFAASSNPPASRKHVATTGIVKTANLRKRSFPPSCEGTTTRDASTEQYPKAQGYLDALAGAVASSAAAAAAHAVGGSTIGVLALAALSAEPATPQQITIPAPTCLSPASSPPSNFPACPASVSPEVWAEFQAFREQRQKTDKQ